MKYVWLIGFFLLFGYHVAAQQASEPEDGYVKSYLTDTRDLATQPLHWQANNWLLAGGAAAGFTVLLFSDESIQIFAQKNRTSTSNWISTYIAEPIGSGLYTLPALAILYGTGWLNHNPKNRYVALKATEAWLLTGGATFVLKQLAHRQRPNEGAGPDAFAWRGPYALGSDYTSFPSGHTSTAFAVATVVARSYDKWWLKALCYTGSTLVGLSRINDNKHWASDVFAGAILGTWVGYSLTKNTSNLQWGASAGSGYFTGTVVLAF